MAEIHVERKKSSFRLAWLLVVVIVVAIVAGLWYAGVIHV